MNNELRAEFRRRNGDMPDRNTEYLLYQTLIGAWPITMSGAGVHAEGDARGQAADFVDGEQRGVRRRAAQVHRGGDAHAPFVTELEQFVGR
jgi:(1->4)-alpha-D-glucan 1-alpha-D-glucosylmutase